MLGWARTSLQVSRLSGMSNTRPEEREEAAPKRSAERSATRLTWPEWSKGFVGTQEIGYKEHAMAGESVGCGRVSDAGALGRHRRSLYFSCTLASPFRFFKLSFACISDYSPNTSSTSSTAGPE